MHCPADIGYVYTYPYQYLDLHLYMYPCLYLDIELY